MKILQVAPRMPYPLTDGGAIGIFNITRGLAQLGHQITLVTFPLEDPKQNSEAVHEISQFATLRLTSKPLPPRWVVLLKTLFRGAYPIERRESRALYEILGSLLSTKQFDVVHIDHSHLAHYALWIKQHFDIPVVLREHNYESRIYERFAQTERNPVKRLVARTHGRRLRIEEDALLNRVDAVAAITAVDEEVIRRAAPRTPIVVIPAGVDTEAFRPSPVPTDPETVLFVGSMYWDPNYDAAVWFMDEVLPLLRSSKPNLRLEFIGAGSERIRDKTSGDPAIVLQGQVPDVRDYLGPATVLVVPLRIGGGMRVKLLEFFAAGKAVVSTSIGAEGNLARSGQELLIADRPEDFAAAVVTLLESQEYRDQLSARARALVEREYSWDHVAKLFEDLYRSVLRPTATSIDGRSLRLQKT